MAGESPDKTEQQKSSGTAPEERDPRFAVFRDPGADADTEAGAEVRTGTGADSEAVSDTATAVFRPRLPEDAARRENAPEPGAAPGSDDEPDSGSAPVTASAASGGSGTPSRAADAVKGRTEPDTEAPGAEERDAETSADPSAGASAPVTSEPVTSEPVTSEPVTSEPVTSEPVTSAVGSSAVGTPAQGPGDEPEPGKPEAREEEGDGRLRAAVAAWVDAAAEDDPKTETEAEAEGARGAEDAGGEPATKPGPESKPGSEAGSASEPGAKAGQRDASEPKPEPGSGPEPKAVEGPKAGAERGKTSAAERGKTSSAERGKASGTAHGEASDAGAESAPASDSDAEPAAGATSDLRGIDQPTAVFTAVKPADRVDQATTALKLPSRTGKPGGTPESEPDGKPAGTSKGGAGAKPENETESTSTFVPLRSDDGRTAPASRKPEAGASAGSAAGSGASARTPEAGSPASPGAAVPSWAKAERTRQQPLPPKPPLDLLAELTNTPPPPETPVRTAVRRVKIWTPLVLLLLIVFAIVQVMRPLPEPSLELTAKPTYTFEGGGTDLSWPGQGQSAVMVDGVGSLGTEGAQKPAPIASVAKVMTAYVILQEHPLKGDEGGEKITVDQQAEDESKRPDESTAPLTKGQELTQRQLLQLLMIPSGNNAARLLARWDAGSEDKFIDKMNDAAEDLGMTGSTYTDPSGLKETTVSTATDQLKLAQAVMRNEVFREIVDMPEVEIDGIDGKIYNNNNILLQPGVSGIKTGSSTPAGGNLLWSANTKVDGKLLWIYGAVMGQQAGTGRVYDSLELSLQNSLKLIKDAQEAPTSATVVKKGDVVGYVDNGFGGQAPVVATKNLKAVGWAGLKVELEVTDNGESIGHAAKAGTEVGSVTVGTGTGKVTAPVVLQSDLPEAAFGDKLTRIG
ncbi:serine hydrolase [Streptomyces sp. NPDC059164]|uniref:serine hydrolase n=1 Tax=Streptomyces sp. NPDC059164 TaxID=3346750 RepID=UPI00369B5A0F